MGPTGEEKGVNLDQYTEHEFYTPVHGLCIGGGLSSSSLPAPFSKLLHLQLFFAAPQTNANYCALQMNLSCSLVSGILTTLLPAPLEFYHMLLAPYH